MELQPGFLFFLGEPLCICGHCHCFRPDLRSFVSVFSSDRPDTGSRLQCGTVHCPGSYRFPFPFKNFTVKLETGSKLSEIRKLYGDFNLMVKELAATEMLQMDFVSNVSHEFKTPISAIDGYATLLQGDSKLTEEQAEYTDKIIYNVRRLSGLVSNILLLSRIENQAIPTKKEKFRLDEQIRQATLALEARWTEKEIDLAAELETVSYIGNETLLIHVWLNLIDNAVKFSPKGGSIWIRLTASEENILVSVRDHGCGIAETDLKRIFDKFYQTDTAHKEEGNGLGAGTQDPADPSGKN